MKIEIVGFYPIENKKPLIGTMHVFVYDIELPFDIRGIGIRKIKGKDKNKYFFQMPGRTVTEKTDGELKKIFYPFFSFFDSDLYKKLISDIAYQGTKFLIEEFKKK
jgi:hypothetical protein